MDTEEAILARHRAEKKDLQNKITGMKKQATKSKRKQVNSRCENSNMTYYKGKKKSYKHLETKVRPTSKLRMSLYRKAQMTK